MLISNEQLRSLCIKHKWFTCGTNRQYDRLFKLNETVATADELALVIWVCSDENVYMRDILDKLGKFEKVKRTKIKWLDEVSQFLQDNGFEDASKAIDCEYEI